MLQSRIVVFLGTVGSGKSTQMRLLASELEKKGLRVKVSFIKTGHLLAYLLIVVLARMLVGERRDVYPIRALLEEKPEIFRRIFRLWLTLDVISISIKFLLNIYIPVKMNRVVLVEEYIPAAIADYVYLSRVVGLPLNTLSSALNYLLRLLYLGGPIKVIFLDADTSELASRWKRRKTPDERSDYLETQRTLLLPLAKSLSRRQLVYIDTSKRTIKETHKLIISSLNGILAE